MQSGYHLRKPNSRTKHIWNGVSIFERCMPLRKMNWFLERNKRQEWI